MNPTRHPLPPTHRMRLVSIMRPLVHSGSFVTLVTVVAVAACRGAPGRHDDSSAAADSVATADATPRVEVRPHEIGSGPALADTALAPVAIARDPSPDTGTARSATPPAADSAHAYATPHAGSSPASSTPAATSSSTPPELPAPGATASAPPATAASPPDPPPAPEAARPFRVGERLSYEVRFGPVRVGTATMEVRGIEQVRGQRAYHAAFEVRGGNRLYAVNDHYESWFSASTLASLRYAQNIDQGSYERLRRFEIFPEKRVFREEGKAEEPSVAEPLDDASFLYFLRTVPLEVGRTYTFDRYFRPDRNPVTVRVLRRERVRVPAGEFDAVVVQPVIKTKGIFSEGGRAEVWFAADSTRRILQIRSRLKFGTLSLHLR